MRKRAFSTFEWMAVILGCTAMVVLIGGCPATPPGDDPPGQTLDGDGDGVVDADDDCADTPAGAAVDDAGCAPSQLDSDGDGVTDDVDTCADTAAGAAVDDEGCSEAQQPPDEDGDGIIDIDDGCPNTPAGADVDGAGCALSQLDSDNDGVTNDLDECANTPGTVQVDDVGCPASQGGPDTDEDGVNDDVDQCPGTESGDDIDANGCADSQLDTDNDGVSDAEDRCPDTAADATVNDEGCSQNQVDTDMDGVPDGSDACANTPIGTPVDATGCRQIGGGGGGGGGGGATCGNGTVEAGEVCDDAGESATCDANCTMVQCGDGTLNMTAGEECDDGNTNDGDSCSSTCENTGGGAGSITADACGDANALEGEGFFSFNNSAATTDGAVSSRCIQFGEDGLANDVWGCWTAPCTGTVFVSTCGATEVDTKIAVYETNGTCDCPTDDAGILECNDDRCDTQSVVTFEATAGENYLVRVGTFPGEAGGAGFLSISCGLDSCGGGGSCFEAGESGGCDDTTCCESVCAVDPFCCNTQWDETCAEEAQGICGTGFNACVDAANTCDATSDATGGCSDSDCCNAVCREDPFCCLSQWDNLCIDTAAFTCPLNCGRGAGACDAANGSPGCEDSSCCGEVCARDPFCCTQEWDATCAANAAEFCAP